MQGSKPDEFIRRPMQWDSTPNTAGFTSGNPWQAPDDNPEAATVSGQLTDPQSLFSSYRALIRLRADHPALRGITLILVESNSSAVYAYIRSGDGETLLIVVNLSSKPVTDYALTLLDSSLPLLHSASLLFGEGQSAPLTSNNAGGFEDYKPLPELPPYAALVILLEP